MGDDFREGGSMTKQKQIIGENLLAKEEIDMTEENDNININETVKQPINIVEAKVLGEPVKNLANKKPFRKKLLLLLIPVVLLVVILLSAIPFFGLVKAMNKMSVSVKNLQEASTSQDLGRVKSSLEQIDKDLLEVDKSLTPLIWVKPIPIIGGYWSDSKQVVIAGHEVLEASKILIPAIEPYADILGFGVPDQPAEEPGAEGAKTAEERIDFIVESLPSVLPKLDEVAVHLRVARDAVNQIDASKYPEKIKGIAVREKLREIIGFVNDMTVLLVDGKPLLKRLPYFLGTDSERTYLVIFQNDKELRPTGGFMTAYSMLKVKDGKMQPVSSDDIYNLDARYKATLDAPEPVVKYLGGPANIPYTHSNKWRLRDMNWSPDFKGAMELFTREAKTAKLGEFDGVIGVDTELLVGLLKVVGRIGVPGYGNYSAETHPKCNCPQVIYELETYADIEGPVVWDPNTGKIVFGRLLDNRKGIVGPLVNSIIANTLAQPKNKVPDIFRVVLDSLNSKHVIFYLTDEESQKALEAFNAAGRIRENNGGDYLAIVDANLGGRKSNLYISQEVVDNIKRSGDKVTHNLEITYKNTQKDDGWLNSVQRDYMRIYLPKGAKVTKHSGVSDQSSYEELGKAVFAGFWELRPLGVTKISLAYEVPVQKGDYSLLIQKQPGTGPANYTINANGNSQEFQLKSDKLLRFKL